MNYIDEKAFKQGFSDGYTTAMESIMNDTDMEIAEEGAQIDSFKIYISQDTKNMKRKYREGVKLRVKSPVEAIDAFKESIEMANDLKKRVDDIKDDAKKYRLLSLFNPLLIFVNNEETTAIIPTGSGYVRTYTTYSDDMSERAKNAMQQQIQQALNLHIKRCNDYIDWIRKRASRMRRK